MLIRHAEVEGQICDVRIEGERIAAVAPTLMAEPGEESLDADGGALLPGLHDHHIHLFALAAAERSIPCGPPRVADADALGAALRAASGERDHEALRGVGYHESVAGPLDRRRLDAWVPDRALRIQHRSGALWMLNTRACALARLADADHPGIERDEAGNPTGRLFRADAWLRSRLPQASPPDLGPIGRRLAAFGVTGVTDATPANGAEELAALTRAIARGELPQRLLLMGRAELPEPDCAARIERGPHKILLTETDFPALETLAADFAAQHARDRSVAVHCVTRAELVFALAAFELAGVRQGDRIEHASIAPPECRDALARQGLAVVTQPNFVAERGDAYRGEVAPSDLPYLYCGASLDAAGIPLGGGTDAPFGDPDPWAAMRAAVERRTRDGACLGPEEALAPERALALFTTPATAPGGPPRRVVPGAIADLCLLDRSWKQARTELASGRVRKSFSAGVPLL